jgi:hypothetical protein
MYVGYWRQLVYGVAREVRGPQRLKPELYTPHAERSVRAAGNSGLASAESSPSAWKTPDFEIALVANVGE